MAKKRSKNKLPTQSVEVQVVTGRHRAPCVSCADDKVPTGKRLVIEKGAGRYAKRSVYCVIHGVTALGDLIGRCMELRDALLKDMRDDDEGD